MKVTRPKITDDMVKALKFARACVLDQRNASHARKDYSWDCDYAEAVAVINGIERNHTKKGRPA